MNDVATNLDAWTKFDWEAGQGGDRWSGSFGSPDAQWYFSLFPRLHRHIPASCIVEIAPGFGRWSQYLIPMSKKYIGIDLTPRCIEACKVRFSSAKNARFAVTDGMTLTGVADNSVDFLFSMDSLVHCHGNVVLSYIKEAMRVLKSDGVAFFHHSNLAAVPEAKSDDRYKTHWRASDVSGSNVRKWIASVGGSTYSHEYVNWGDSPYLIDCYTVFGRFPRNDMAFRQFENNRHMEEASYIKSMNYLYCKS